MNDSESPNTSSSSFDEARAEQWLRIGELQNRVRELNGGEMPFSGSAEGGDPDRTERYWQSIVCFMEAEETTVAHRLARRGVKAPDLSTLPKRKTHRELWRLIRGLARDGILLMGTNHLSDRAFLRVLVEQILPAPIQDGRLDEDDFIVLDVRDYAPPPELSVLELLMQNGPVDHIPEDFLELAHRAMRGVSGSQDRDADLPGPPKNREVTFHLNRFPPNLPDRG